MIDRIMRKVLSGCVCCIVSCTLVFCAHECAALSPKEDTAAIEPGICAALDEAQAVLDGTIAVEGMSNEAFWSGVDECLTPLVADAAVRTAWDDFGDAIVRHCRDAVRWRMKNGEVLSVTLSDARFLPRAVILELLVAANGASPDDAPLLYERRTQVPACLGRLTAGIALINGTAALLVRVQPNPDIYYVRPASKRHALAQWHRVAIAAMMRCAAEAGLRTVYAVPAETCYETDPYKYETWWPWTKHRSLVEPFLAWKRVAASVEWVFYPFDQNLDDHRVYTLLACDPSAEEPLPGAVLASA